LTLTRKNHHDAQQEFPMFDHRLLLAGAGPSAAGICFEPNSDLHVAPGTPARSIARTADPRRAKMAGVRRTTGSFCLSWLLPELLPGRFKVAHIDPA
jgi:hypothetical protein